MAKNWCQTNPKKEWSKLKGIPKSEGSYSKFPIEEFEKHLSKQKDLTVKSGEKDPAKIIYQIVHNKDSTFILNQDGSRGRCNCGPGRRRSREDVYRALRALRPGITFAEVSFIMTRLQSNSIVSRNFCSTTRKDVYQNYSVLITEDKFVKTVNQAIHDYEKANKSDSPGKTGRS